MQETRNNCFGSKKCSTTLLQAKTVKHECRNVIVTRCCYSNCYCNVTATFFRPETIVASFLHSMVLLPKVFFNHFEMYLNFGHFLQKQNFCRNVLKAKQKLKLRYGTTNFTCLFGETDQMPKHGEN